MDTYLKCWVRPGQFTGEVAVHGRTFDGAEFSLFVSDDVVDYSPPAGSGVVEGWLRVEVIGQNGNLRLVRLPGETFENGRTVTVQASEVTRRKRRQEA